VSDYTLSFDAMMNVTGGGFQLICESWAAPGIVGTRTGEGITVETVSSANVYQHYSINLGSLYLDPYGAATLPNPSGGSLQIGWQVATGLGTISEPAVGDKIVIDNVRLEMVPEPSTIAFFALAGLTGLFIRRQPAC
jgi:hypothetical protein